MSSDALHVVHGQEDSRSNTRYLPTELLISIFDEVPDDELLVVALTSQRFHTIALEILFEKQGVDPYSKEVRIDNCLFGVPKVLQALSLSLNLVGTSIEHFSYACGDFSNPSLIAREAYFLTNYISKLSSLKRVSLEIGVPGYPNTAASERRKMCITFLNDILGKDCNELRITTVKMDFYHPESRSMLPDSILSDWLTNYWPVDHGPPSEQHLESCYINRFPRFLRPFWFHTLRSNSASITDLGFEHINIGATDWATMLIYLHFPHLRRLIIASSEIPLDPFIKFLAKHVGTLTEFEYYCVNYRPDTQNAIQSAALEPVFQTLGSLKTTPEHINNFFLPLLSSMFRLTNVILTINKAITTPATFKTAFTHLALCVNKLTLTLRFRHMYNGLDLAHWLWRTVGKGSDATAMPECKLHCIETLVIDYGDHDFLDGDIVEYLQAFVAQFPDLRALVLRGQYPILPPNCAFSSRMSCPDEDVVAKIQEACPELHVEYKQYDARCS